MQISILKIIFSFLLVAFYSISNGQSDKSLWKTTLADPIYSCQNLDHIDFGDGLAGGFIGSHNSEIYLIRSFKYQYTLVEFDQELNVLRELEIGSLKNDKFRRFRGVVFDDKLVIFSYIRLNSKTVELFMEIIDVRSFKKVDEPISLGTTMPKTMYYQPSDFKSVLSSDKSKLLVWCKKETKKYVSWQFKVFDTNLSLVNSSNNTIDDKKAIVDGIYNFLIMDAEVDNFGNVTLLAYERADAENFFFNSNFKVVYAKTNGSLSENSFESLASNISSALLINQNGSIRCVGTLRHSEADPTYPEGIFFAEIIGGSPRMINESILSQDLLQKAGGTYFPDDGKYLLKGDLKTVFIDDDKNYYLCFEHSFYSPGISQYDVGWMHFVNFTVIGCNRNGNVTFAKVFDRNSRSRGQINRGFVSHVKKDGIELYYVQNERYKYSDNAFEEMPTEDQKLHSRKDLVYISKVNSAGEVKTSYVKDLSLDQYWINTTFAQAIGKGFVLSLGHKKMKNNRTISLYRLVSK